MALDELDRAAPGVIGVRLELDLLAVEEAVRRAVVDDHLVLDPRRRERRVEGLVVLDGDRRVGAPCSARIGAAILGTSSSGGRP